MFTSDSFDVFTIEGLDNRMVAIREQIQPVFQELDTYFVECLSSEIGETLPIHIAQHRRRTANAPDFTWSAMGGDKRGYKKYPHFQLGITGDYVVMWLSFIDNPEFEKEMARSFLAHPELFEGLPKDMMINHDHTVNTYEALTETSLVKVLERFEKVKKGEFQIGRIVTKEEITHLSGTEAKEYMRDTYLALLPIYQHSMAIRQNALSEK